MLKFLCFHKRYDGFIWLSFREFLKFLQECPMLASLQSGLNANFIVFFFLFLFIPHRWKRNIFYIAMKEIDRFDMDFHDNKTTEQRDLVGSIAYRFLLILCSFKCFFL